MATRTESRRTPVSQLEPAWHVIDAEGRTLGRLASEIAVILQGKHKPTYVSYLNSGDFVIVVNAEKVRVTGKKLQQKLYYRHSGYHGGLKQRTLSELIEKAPTRAIRQSVKGMLPKSKLGRRMLSRLKLYTGGSHPHAAQVNVRRKSEEEEAAPEPAPRAVRTGPSAKGQDQAVAESPPAAAAAPESPEPSAATSPKARRPRATSESRAKAAGELMKEETAAEAAEPKTRTAQKPRRPKAASKAGAASGADAPSTEATAEAAETEPTLKRKPRRPHASSTTRSNAGEKETPSEKAPGEEEA